MLGFILVILSLFLYVYVRHDASAGELMFMLGIFASAGYIGGYWDGHRKNKNADDMSRLILEEQDMPEETQA